MADRAADPSPGWHRPPLTAALSLGLFGVLVAAVVTLPRGDSPLPWVARHAMLIALPRWGQTEAVNEIVYGSRAFDTFGETFLLIAAVLGVVVLARGREPRREYVGEAAAGLEEQRSGDTGGSGAGGDEREARGAEQEESDEDQPGEPRPPADSDAAPLGVRGPERAMAMSPIVRVATRVVAPVLAVAAVFIAAWGYTPGGGFPAGVAIVGVVVTVYAAFGHQRIERVVRPGLVEPVELVGALAIVAIGLIGLLREGSLFANWVPLAEQQTIPSGGTIQLVSAGELVEVATGLTVAIFALLGMRHEWTPDEDDDEDHDRAHDQDHDSAHDSAHEGADDSAHDRAAEAGR